MKPLLLFVRTLVYLRPTQVLAQILKRVRRSPTQGPHIHELRLRPGVGFSPCLPPARLSSSHHSFSFLNQEWTFPSGAIDWAIKDMPKLWRYNLHYFEYLFDAGRSQDCKVHLISDWIAKNPPGIGDGWEPYTVSLRIVNWIKFFLEHDKALQESWLQSLYQQALWLEKNVEYHILANHYLKNGVALYFAGMYFEGVDADRWIKKGLNILREELKEQFLADGGHYERSPMYHSICVSDYLDVLNLVQSSRTAVKLDEVTQFRRTVTACLNFLHVMCFPDQEIPLFNDSAFGIAPSPSQIFSYAKRVMGYETPATFGGVELYEQSESGYYICRNGDDMFVIDCGPIGPDYQPGHAHCDTLSYELAIDGQRVIVDSGVFDYELSSERAYARSTRAHNTVVVDGEEQSEMWGVFRVARRAKPLRAVFTKQVNGAVKFEGGHDGYKRLPGKPIHRRQLSYDGQGSWVITDMLEGKGVHRMESYVHIHPDFHVVRIGACIGIVAPTGRTIAIIERLGSWEPRLEQGWYFPEFGLKHKNHVIVFYGSHETPFSLSYRIQKAVRQVS
jgi:uncharacterized heparinase superfamily protein